MKSAGIIVTYNRKELLAENIRMQLKQVRRLDGLYIIDNHGTDGTYEYLRQQDLFDETWMEYVYLDENTGGAGGFYHGTKIAYESGYDLIWLMDDDGRPLDAETWKNMYDAAVKAYHGLNTMLFLNSVVTDHGKCLTFGFRSSRNLQQQFAMMKELAEKQDIYAGYANPFNGTLVSRETIQKAGLPNKDFFMCRDETDYLRRCEDEGAYIGTVLRSLYHHPRGTDRKIKIGNIRITLIKDCNKQYYWLRNMTYSYQHTHRFRLVMLLSLYFLAIIFWQEDKKKRIRCFFRAVSDAWNGRMGRRTYE